MTTEPPDPSGEEQLAVIDLGSNSFRLVAYDFTPGAWWKRSDEIYESVRIGAGLNGSGELKAKPMARAQRTLEAFAHFLTATGVCDVHTVATSAIREAANRDQFISNAEKLSGLQIEVISREQEARYGYLAAVNSTTLSDGVVLDLGGGSLQLVSVSERQAVDPRSWRLGAVRMTERFLPDDEAPAKQIKALRKHVGGKLAEAEWLAAGPDRIVGIGGTVRNLAVAAQVEAELPSFGVQGFCLTREALGQLIERFTALPKSKRGGVPGIKPERGDIILAGAIVIDCVLEAGGFEEIEVTEEGLREGIFFSTFLADHEPPLFEDVRRASVYNLGGQYDADRPHTEHVAQLALTLYDDLVSLGVQHSDPVGRELLWATAILHDIGIAVDYDDHHKHSRYLILNAGLPGYTQRETALVAQLTRYHRKGTPSGGWLKPLLKRGDEKFLLRGAALLRLAEQLERSRDQAVKSLETTVDVDGVQLRLRGEGNLSVACWAAQRHAALFEAAFGRPLEITE